MLLVRCVPDANGVNCRHKQENDRAGKKRGDAAVSVFFGMRSITYHCHVGAFVL